jgi:heme O synthase-like polyprenyltransferase
MAYVISLALRLRAVEYGGEGKAKHLFAYSIIYLFLLFVTLLLSAGIGRG